MKIKVTELDYDSVMALPKPKHVLPKMPNFFFRMLQRLLAIPDLVATRFSYQKVGMEKLKKNEPKLIFMNHSSFLDLEIISKMMFPEPYNIVCTGDGFVGKENLMRNLGCIPTSKFVTELRLIKDISYALHTNKTSVLMYPEASYSFDGRETTLPKTLGSFVKMMKVPLVTVITEGSFSRDPLYNLLQKRKVKVKATMKCLLTKEEVEEKSAEEINTLIQNEFTLDYFMWQRKNHILISELFRADGLNRILYRCPACGSEGQTEGKGVHLTCHACGKKYLLTEEGAMKSEDGKTDFDHIPDWSAWERECVKKEIENGTYLLDTDVDICMLVDFNSLYRVGSGHLTHNKDGFVLTGCDGKINYKQSPLSSYGLYADFFWYELGDMICIGDQNKLFYCFPKDKKDIVAKTRMATEILYQMAKETKAK